MARNKAPKAPKSSKRAAHAAPVDPIADARVRAVEALSALDAGLPLDPRIVPPPPPPSPAQVAAAAQEREIKRVAAIEHAALHKLLPTAVPFLRIPAIPAQALKHALLTRDLLRSEVAECDGLIARLDGLAYSGGLLGGAADLLDPRLAHALSDQERDLLPLCLAAKKRQHRAHPDLVKPEPPGLREVKAQVAAKEGGHDARLAVLESGQTAIMDALARLERVSAPPALGSKKKARAR